MSDATYRVVAEGELDDRFAYLFSGMEMTHAEGTTILTGPVVDQVTCAYRQHEHGRLRTVPAGMGDPEPVETARSIPYAPVA